MSMGLIQAVWTLIAFVVFVSIVIWAWSDDRKADFEKASRMALDDDESLGESENDSEVGSDSEIRGHHG